MTRKELAQAIGQFTCDLMFERRQGRSLRGPIFIEALHLVQKEWTRKAQAEGLPIPPKHNVFLSALETYNKQCRKARWGG